MLKCSEIKVKGDISERGLCVVFFFVFADLEMAVAYWNLVLSGRFKFLDLWNRFLLVSQKSEIREAPIKYVRLVSHQHCLGIHHDVTDPH